MLWLELLVQWKRIMFKKVSKMIILGVFLTLTPLVGWGHFWSSKIISVLALSHSIIFELNRKFIPSSSNKSLPMIMSYLLKSLSVSSAKAVKLIVLFLWKAESEKLNLHVLVALELSVFVFQLDGLSICWGRLPTSLWWIRVAPQPVSKKIPFSYDIWVKLFFLLLSTPREIVDNVCLVLAFLDGISKIFMDA